MDYENSMGYNLKYKNKNIDLHAYEQKTLNYSKGIYEKGYNTVICGHFDYFVIILAVQLALYDYTINALFKNDPIKRPTFLILGNSFVIRRIFNDISINVNDLCELCIKKGNLIRRDYEVFLEMKDPENRHLYWFHYINERYKDINVPEYLPLNNFFPVASLHKDGTYTIIDSRDYFGRNDSQEPVFFFSSIDNYKYMISERFDYIFLDYKNLSTSKIVIDSSIPTMHIFNSITDSRVNKLYHKNTSVFSWTQKAYNSIAMNCPICISDNFSLNNYNICTNEGLKKPNILRCTGEVNNIFKDIGKNLRDIITIAKKNKHFEELQGIINKMCYAYQIFKELSIFPKYYDNIAGRTGYTFTIIDLLNDISTITQTLGISDGEIRTLMYETGKEFHRLNKMLGNNNIKNSYLNDFLKTQLESSDKLIIVSKNVTLSVAIKKYIIEKLGIENLEEQNIYVVPYKKINNFLRKIKNEDENNFIFIFTGLYKGIIDFILNPIIKNIYFILYDEELKNIYYELNNCRSRLIEINRNNKNPLVYNSSKSEEQDYMLSIMNDIANLLNKKVKSYNSPNSIFSNLIETASSSEEQQISLIYSTKKYSYDTYKSNNSIIIAKELIFNDSTRMMIPKDHNLYIMGKVNKSIEKKNISKIKVNDRILIINGNGRNNLYDILIENLEDQPEVNHFIKFIKFWQNNIKEKFYIKDYTYEYILNQLKSLGSSITTSATVGNWIRGDVLGPDDPNDIYRLGEIMNSSELTKWWKEIYKAIKKIRSIHRLAAFRLNEAIRSSIKINDNKKDSLFNDWGINVYDLKELIQIKTIKEISDDDYYVKYSDTGINYH